MGNDNAEMAAAFAATAKAKFGADLIAGTLDAVNKIGSKKKSGCSSDMAASQDFQKAVLSAAFQPKGTITSVKS